MQITADVAVPNDLVQAARSGRLVLFIGAGASRNAPSSLPLFNGLAKSVAAALGEPYAETENPDSQLGDMHSRHSSVKELVRAIIGDTASFPNDTHRAIARLAGASGSRIVSTNYDEHVETAARNEGITLGRTYFAPALPLGRNFDGVIYLHGSVSEDAETLVLTDQDFGRAYLTDGWARRFAHELFLNWTVLFIGYSHNDVVMTYLARGLPSGAKRYVLTAEPNHKRWRPLSIIPVPYPPDDDHKALTVALDAWADLMRMGQLEHYARVREIVSGAPPKAPEEIDYLADAVTTPAGLRGFVSLARGYDWLRWAEAQAGFKELFRPGRRTDVTSAIWAAWFVEHFVSDPAHSELGLVSIARLGPVLSADLIWRIGQAQSGLHAASPQEARRWDAALKAAVRTDGGEVDSAWYQPYGNPYTGVALLPSLRRALTPRLLLSERRSWLPLIADDEDDAENTAPAGVSAAIEWSISEGLLKTLWERLATQMDLVAVDALQVAEQGLKEAYALVHAFDPDRSFDSCLSVEARSSRTRRISSHMKRTSSSICCAIAALSRRRSTVRLQDDGLDLSLHCSNGSVCTS
ncbi:SIR2 family protein [Microbacterium sp. K24]|uniref:SIR2 family protein n=1 Tax=Microbacterium sp. K24 TaxID=2305446 RepID=UPI00109CDD9D|nr:SIR2 family protein [Microbacterium sp. K24]